MITFPSIEAAANDLGYNNIFDLVGSGPPVNGTTGTGAGFAGPGSLYNDTTTTNGPGDIYVNIGTLASPVWALAAGQRIGTVIETVISSALVKTLRATPQTVIPAPGAGKFLSFDSGVAVLLYGGTNAFTGAQNLALKNISGSGTTVSGAITGAGFVDQTSSMAQPIVPVAGAIYSKANIDNQVIVIHNTGAAEITGNAAGDNKLLIKLYYTTWTPGW